MNRTSGFLAANYESVYSMGIWQVRISYACDASVNKIGMYFYTFDNHFIIPLYIHAQEGNFKQDGKTNVLNKIKRTSYDCKTHC